MRLHFVAPEGDPLAIIAARLATDIARARGFVVEEPKILKLGEEAPPWAIAFFTLPYGWGRDGREGHCILASWSLTEVAYYTSIIPEQLWSTPFLVGLPCLKRTPPHSLPKKLVDSITQIVEGYGWWNPGLNRPPWGGSCPQNGKDRLLYERWWEKAINAYYLSRSLKRP